MNHTTATLTSTLGGTVSAMADFNLLQFLGTVILAWVVGKGLDFLYSYFKK